MEEAQDDELDWEEWNPKKISFFHHMIAGSIAGLAEHISIFPIDTLKTNMQCERCGSMNPTQTWACASKIVQREGIFRLWRGVGATFAGCIPAHAAYFSVYELMKEHTTVKDGRHHPIRAAFCGAVAAISHDLCMNPFDVIKQRMQLGYYFSVGHCLKTIALQEGPMAFYVSMPTTLAMNIPYGCVMMATNEWLKKVLSPDGSFSISTSMISGSVAGGCAAACTNPFDIIKTKLQTRNLEPCPRAINATTLEINPTLNPINPNAYWTPKIDASNASGSATHMRKQLYAAPLEVAKSIWKYDGIKGFFRGILPRVLTQAPAVAISWTAYESAKELLATYT